MAHRISLDEQRERYAAQDRALGLDHRSADRAGIRDDPARGVLAPPPWRVPAGGLAPASDHRSRRSLRRRPRGAGQPVAASTTGSPRCTRRGSPRSPRSRARPRSTSVRAPAITRRSSPCSSCRTVTSTPMNRPGLAALAKAHLACFEHVIVRSESALRAGSAGSRRDLRQRRHRRAGPGLADRAETRRPAHLPWQPFGRGAGRRHAGHARGRRLPGAGDHAGRLHRLRRRRAGPGCGRPASASIRSSARARSGWRASGRPTRPRPPSTTRCGSRPTISPRLTGIDGIVISASHATHYLVRRSVADARHLAAARENPVPGDPARPAQPCRSMSAIAATSPACIATSMPARTAPRRWSGAVADSCSNSSSGGASRRSTSPAARPSSIAHFRRLVTAAREHRRAGDGPLQPHHPRAAGPGRPRRSFSPRKQVEIVASMPCYLRGQRRHASAARACSTARSAGCSASTRSATAATARASCSTSSTIRRGPRCRRRRPRSRPTTSACSASATASCSTSLFTLANMPIQRFGAIAAVARASSTPISTCCSTRIATRISTA